MERENETIAKLKCPECGSEWVWFEAGRYGDWHLKCYKCRWHGRRGYSLQEVNEEFFGKGTGKTQ